MGMTDTKRVYIFPKVGSVAAPRYVYHGGREYDVPTRLADKLIARGQARHVGGGEGDVATAMLKKPKGRGRD